MTTWLDSKLENATAPSAPTQPSRVIGTAYQPSTTNAVMVAVTIELVGTAGQDGNVSLKSDSASTPTTERASARLAVGSGGPSITVRQQLCYIVPAGHYVKLVAGGTGTQTVIDVVETVLN
jgi:hypothetical protein